MTVLFANYTSTTVAGTIAAIDTTIVVTANGTFPTPNPGLTWFYATLIDAASAITGVVPPLKREIVKVTAIVGTTWTVVRGQDGTTATTWAIGDAVELRLNAAAMSDALSTGIYINVKSFGALGNDVADDTTAIQNAINSVATGASAVVYFPKGTYKITAALTMTGSNMTLLGDNQFGSLLKQYTNNVACLNNSGFSNQVEKLGFTYSPVGVPGATAIISSGFNFVARDFIVIGGDIGLQIATGTGMRFSDFQIQNFVRVGILVTGPIGDAAFSRFILNAGNATNGSLGGIRMTDQCEAIFFDTADVLSGVFPMTTTATSYAIGARPGYCRFTNVFFDSGAKNVELDRIVDTEFIGCWFSNGRSGVGFDGVTLQTTDGLRFTNCIAFNCGANGFGVSTNAVRTSFVNCKADSNSVTTGAGVSHGFSVAANTNDFSFTNCWAKNGGYTPGTQGYGIFIAAGTSDRYVITDCNLYGNLTGNMLNGGTGLVKYINELLDNRYRGDFSNATAASRKMFQTNTLNSNSFVGVIPNGTALNGSLEAFNASDPNNASWLRLQAGNGNCDLHSNKNGTGVIQPLRFLVNSVVAVNMDASANVQILKGEANTIAAAKTANYTVLTTDRYLRGTVAGGSFAFTLPAANALGAGISQVIDIKRTDSSANTLTVQRGGADTIDGGTSTTLAALAAKQFRSDGVSNWDII